MVNLEKMDLIFQEEGTAEASEGDSEGDSEGGSEEDSVGGFEEDLRKDDLHQDLEEERGEDLEEEAKKALFKEDLENVKHKIFTLDHSKFDNSNFDGESSNFNE